MGLKIIVDLISQPIFDNILNWKPTKQQYGRQWIRENRAINQYLSLFFTNIINYHNNYVLFII